MGVGRPFDALEGEKFFPTESQLVSFTAQIASFDVSYSLVRAIGVLSFVYVMSVSKVFLRDYHGGAVFVPLRTSSSMVSLGTKEKWTVP